MRRINPIVLLITMLACKQKKVVVNIIPEPPKEVYDIEEYVTDIESFVMHINVSTKDFDSISVAELNSIKTSRHFTKNVTQKNLIYRNGKIVKVKYRDFLENNFIKIKSFYYDEDELVCVKIYELLPSISQGAKIYSRKIYYKENSLLYDSNIKDNKYHTKKLLSFATQKLEEEYEAKSKI